MAAVELAGSLDLPGNCLRGIRFGIAEWQTRPCWQSLNTESERLILGKCTTGKYTLNRMWSFDERITLKILNYSALEMVVCAKQNQCSGEDTCY
uniref:Uncharacterized protein n=1 Tax=Oryza punctata TaxID=4537 RepID=A0A0E0JV07_ORYPU